MIFWLVSGGLTLIVVGAIAWPLLRDRAEARDGADYDIEVFRDQLAEVQREHAEGRLDYAEAEAAKAEISRRILAADARRKASVSGGGRSGYPALAAVLAVILAGGSTGLYLSLGSPDKPARPFAAREAERGRVAKARGDSMDLAAVAARLRERLEKGEGDARGWQLLARTYMTMGRYSDAVPVYERILGVGAQDAATHAAYGEALALAAEGQVTPRSRAAFEKAHELAPQDPTARFYLALADWQAGAHRKAYDAWAALLSDTPADAPWLDVVRQRTTEAAEKLGLDVAAAVPQPKPAAAPPQSAGQGTAAAPGGPTPAEMAAARDMSPEARQTMIRGMVDGLAAKLETNPGDFQGWMRLIRSYGVLGETAKGEAALAKALGHFANAPFPKRQLLALGDELGFSVPGARAEVPGNPSAEDVRAAQEMSPEDRQAMIRGMVDGLAAKLEENPDNLPGWLRLIRSYTVLGERAKAVTALETAMDRFAGAPDATRQLVALAGDLGLSEAAERSEPSSPRGPTEADREAAQNLSPEARRAMIEGMVDGLAARLKQNPEDLQGWVRLARAYNVLGRPAEARDAMAGAARAAPENIDILTLHARAIRSAAGNRPTGESLSIMQKILTLDPDNVEALFFVGLAAVEAGRPADARAHWKKALSSLPSGSPERAALKRQIDSLPQ